MNVKRFPHYTIAIICFLMLGRASYSQTCENSGIGTATPGSKLEIKGCGEDSATSSLNVTDTNGTSILYVQDNQRIGINNENPRTSLQIQSDATGGLNLNNTKGDPRIGYYLNSNSDPRFTLGVDSSDAKKFKIGTTALETNTRITIDSTGKVGIGTTTPGALLEVNGDAIFNEGSGSYDFRVEGNTDTNLLFLDGSADNVGIGTNAPGAKLDVRGTAIFNEGSGSYDFRIESNTNANMFFVDASADRIGVGTNSPSAQLHLEKIDANAEIYARSIKDAGSNGVVRLGKAKNNAGSPELNGSTDLLGQIIYQGYDGDQWTNAASVRAVVDGAPGNDDMPSKLVLQTTPDGSKNSVDRLTVKPDGKVGIATSSPSEVLDVDGNGRFRSVGSGTYANDLNITSNGTLTTSSSDRRLKTDIKPLENSLERILDLDGKSFYWKEKPNAEKRDIGFIAQDVEKVIPEVVFTNKTDGYMGINYSRFAAILTEAIKEQQTVIDNHTDKFEEMSSYAGMLNESIPSDQRVKKEVSPFTDGLSVIKQIDPVSYKYNGLANTPNDNRVNIGVVAQDIQGIAPYTVNPHIMEVSEDDLSSFPGTTSHLRTESTTLATDSIGGEQIILKDIYQGELLSFNRTPLTYVLINAVKELDAENQALTTELNAIKSRLSALENK